VKKYRIHFVTTPNPNIPSTGRQDIPQREIKEFSFSSMDISDNEDDYNALLNFFDKKKNLVFAIKQCNVLFIEEIEK
jgi:hypothetical protein